MTREIIKSGKHKKGEKRKSGKHKAGRVRSEAAKVKEAARREKSVASMCWPSKIG